MSNKFAVVSDLHCGVHQNSEKWLKETLKFAKWFKDELYSKGIRDIIIAGDFFHDRTDINLVTIQYAALILDEWKDFHIWLIPGNHDCFYKDNASISSISIFRGRSNVTVFDEPQELIRNSKAIGFIPWGTSITNIPTCDVMIGHFELNGFKTNAYKVCDHGDNGEDLLDKTKLVLTGHFHIRQERRSERGTVLYVGSPYQMDYNDLNVDKGYHILDVDSMNVEFVIYPHTTKHKKIALTDLITHKDNLTAYLETEIKGNVVTFVVDKDIEFEKITALVQKIQSFEPLVFRGTDIVTTKDIVKIEDVKSNVQIEQLIEDFIKHIEMDNSDQVLLKVLELYKKHKII